MNNCLNCNLETKNPKFCSQSCSATFTNKLRTTKRENKKCLFCNNNIAITKSKNNIFCNVECSGKFKNKQNIEKWLSGEIDGLDTLGNLKSFLKDYLRKIRGDKCELCGWDKINPVTKKVPIVADHIDGNYKNNRPENIRLICPNCDSLQPTYKALNIGKGRAFRIEPS